MLKALLLQLIFSIQTISLLIVFLKYSQELRDLCGFDVVPDASKFTRFKQNFLMDLQSMFDHLVDLTEPICQRIDKQKASMLLFGTSGIEAWVTENTPKYANRIIRQLKVFKKANGMDDSYGSYKAAFGSMPSMPLPIPPSSRCTLTDISVMPLNSTSSQTDLTLSGTSAFMTKTFLMHTLTSWLKRNPTLRMRIKTLRIPKR